MMRESLCSPVAASIGEGEPTTAETPGENSMTEGDKRCIRV